MCAKRCKFAVNVMDVCVQDTGQAFDSTRLQFRILRNFISGTWSSCGGESNLYSTSLNPFTGERERDRQKEGGAEEEVSGRRTAEGGRDGRGTESDGKINRVAGKPGKKPFRFLRPEGNRKGRKKQSQAHSKVSL